MRWIGAGATRLLLGEKQHPISRRHQSMIRYKENKQLENNGKQGKTIKTLYFPYFLWFSEFVLVFTDGIYDIMYLEV